MVQSIVRSVFTLGSCRMSENVDDPHCEFLSIKSREEADIVVKCRKCEVIFIDEMHRV